MLIGVLNLQLSRVDNDDGVPTLWDCVRIGMAGIDLKLSVKGWCLGGDCALDPKYIASNDFGLNITVIIGFDIGCGDLLILRLTILSLSLKIDPELKSM